MIFSVLLHVPFLLSLPLLFELLMRDAFNSVNFDSEKDRIKIGCPQIVVSCDGRAKWGERLIDAAETAVLSIIQIEEEEKEEKERAKALKKSKQNKL